MNNMKPYSMSWCGAAAQATIALPPRVYLVIQHATPTPLLLKIIELRTVNDIWKFKWIFVQVYWKGVFYTCMCVFLFSKIPSPIVYGLKYYRLNVAACTHGVWTSASNKTIQPSVLRLTSAARVNVAQCHDVELVRCGKMLEKPISKSINFACTTYIYIYIFLFTHKRARKTFILIGLMF